MKVCEVENCENDATRDICRPHQLDVRYWRLEPMPHWKTKPNPECEVEGCGRAAQSKRVIKCKLHRDYEREGRDLETVRPKMRNGSSNKPCSWGGCDKQSRARGMCEQHYYYLKRELKMALCRVEGCGTRTKNDWCARHDPAKAPKPWPMGPCSVRGCERTYRSRMHTFCKHHNRVRTKMGLTNEEFQYIKDRAECQVCGAGDVLVVDHWHGCHPEDKTKMCKKCIRGVMCSRCNSALAFLSEDPKKILALANYAEMVRPGDFFGTGSGPGN